MSKKMQIKGVTLCDGQIWEDAQSDAYPFLHVKIENDEVYIKWSQDGNKKGGLPFSKFYSEGELNNHLHECAHIDELKLYYNPKNIGQILKEVKNDRRK